MIAMNNIRAVIDGIIENKHAKIVVAGVLGDNFPPHFYDCPQIVMWTAEEGHRKKLPAATKLVFTTRFMGHGSLAHLDKECKLIEAIRDTKAYGTGELRSILEPLVTHHLTQKLPIPATVVAEVAKPAKVFQRGEFAKFVRKHMQGNGKQEVIRIQALLKEEGWGEVPEENIYKTLSRLNKEKIRAEKPAPAENQVAEAKPTNELITLLDDAISALHLVREALWKQTDASAKLAKVLEALK